MFINKECIALPMFNKKQYLGISFIVIALVISGLLFYDYQKTITGQAISSLDEQLKEQEKILEEQESESEEQYFAASVERNRLIDEIEELSKETCKDVQVPYDAEEEYTEQEPYLKQEQYYEREPYVVEECESINVVYSKISNFCTGYVDNMFFEDEPAKHSITINNKDSEKAGWFYVDMGFYIDGQIVKESQQEYIYPDSSATFYVEQMSAEVGSCYSETIRVPTKRICEDVTKYQDVPKTREVTDYKTVTKTRTITKYRTETVCE